MAERLISADSHVRITSDSVRERLSAKVAAQYDDALKALAAEEDELRGGQSFGLGNFDLEGARATLGTGSRTRASRRWTATVSRPRCSTPSSARSVSSTSSPTTGRKSRAPSTTA